MLSRLAAAGLCLTLAAGLLADRGVRAGNPERVRRRQSGFVSASPDQVPEASHLQAWWRGDTQTFQDSALTIAAVADGDPVGGWVDRFAGVAATQTTTGRRPTLRLGVVAGQPALQFTIASQTSLNANSIGAAFAGTQPDQTHFLVLKATSAQTMALLSLGGAASLDELAWRTNGYRYQQSNDSGTNVQLIAGTTDTTSFHVLVGRSQSGVLLLRSDGLPLATLAGVAGPQTTTAYSIAIQRGGTVIAFGGFIAELVSYNVSLSISSIAAIETYLGRRYAIPPFGP